MAGGWRTRARIAFALSVVAVLGAVAGGPGAHLARAATARIADSVTPSAVAQARASTTSVSPTLRLHVTVTLRPRDPAALAAYARDVSTPGSADYHRYLTPRQFARRFGASPDRIDAVRASLRAHGLSPGATSAGGLSIPVTATAARLGHGLSTSLRRIRVAGRRTAVAATSQPAFGAAAAHAVQSVVGLDTTAAAHPLAIRARPADRARSRARAAARPRGRRRVATGGPQPCAAAQQAAPTQGAYTDDQIASAYGFSGLYATGDEGAGTTVAVYELEPNDPHDVAAFQSCYGTHAPISYVSVDGGAGQGAGSDEAAFDIENLIGFAPRASVIVYRGPNSNSGAPGSGPYDTFASIVDQDRARVVSVSWGQCEAQLGRSSATAENQLFQQAAVQGQSIVAAAGDNGAEDCDTGGRGSSNRPAVDDPASQPYVTGVGGTTLAALGPPPTETAWNSGGGIASGGPAPGAGGGGVSSLWPMPAPQLDAGAALHVRTSATAGSHCGRSSGYCRAAPDVSADADPSTGYLVYFNGADSVPGVPAGWQGLGGTSGAAPLWAALLALADSSPACHGTPIGYANPALYRAATGAYAADFHDITSGDNDFTHTAGGRYAAGTGYDPVTGLGTPNATALAGSLCADTVRLGALADQTSAVHGGVALRIRATDVRATKLTYSARGLPAGLRIDAATGRISGQAARRGRFTVHAQARDAQGATAATTFTWTIGAAPQLSRASVTGTRLGFTVGGGPAIRQLRITVPRGLRVATTARGISVTSGGRATRFTVHGSGGAVTIVLADAATGAVRVALGPPALRRAGEGSTQLTVAVQTGSTGTTTLGGR